MHLLLFLDYFNIVWYEFFKEWQTLAAGLIAFLGALITTVILLFQLFHEKKKYKEQLRRNALHLRSQISDALCDLIRYTEQCFSYIETQKLLPKKPNKAINIIRENILYADPVTSQNLFKIISFYQVHNSRIESYRLSITRNKKERMQYDIALLSHYFTCLFSYARNEEKSVTRIFPNQKEMASSLRGLIGRETYMNDLTKYEGILESIEDAREREEKRNQRTKISYISYILGFMGRKK